MAAQLACVWLIIFALAAARVFAGPSIDTRNGSIILQAGNGDVRFETKTGSLSLESIKGMIAKQNAMDLVGLEARLNAKIDETDQRNTATGNASLQAIKANSHHDTLCTGAAQQMAELKSNMTRQRTLLQDQIDAITADLARRSFRASFTTSTNEGDAVGFLTAQGQAEILGQVAGCNNGLVGNFRLQLMASLQDRTAGVQVTARIASTGLSNEDGAV
eukprot:TRINITY_DN12182_c0_g1_i10.p2 TRINITY_DN12182_c0_g1~~TRINITY_DN12182_c0_g1_i10.p2  ORF type:complete len:218 (+),score=26.48 TRINITY_DN12182_c0_g1_i10:249-902(+)